MLKLPILFISTFKYFCNANIPNYFQGGENIASCLERPPRYSLAVSQCRLYCTCIALKGLTYLHVACLPSLVYTASQLGMLPYNCNPGDFNLHQPDKYLPDPNYMAAMLDLTSFCTTFYPKQASLINSTISSSGNFTIIAQ